ncbi:vitelline membrane outer layer protein 1 homolog [Hemicordylus capensis]|uniref:vitelline membrane outer layer protein 1 homolog n=1 Tax=Hemicordylus capensis TaxID=884348 RepID=UPI002304AF95|nr:vitelline membrane outer layer protein 1 homolog [Hemicordylus capensis]
MLGPRSSPLLACLLLSLGPLLGAPPPPRDRQVLRVKNGGKEGDWGWEQCCPNGTLAHGLSLKVDFAEDGDRSGLNAIKLHCSDGATSITSTQAPFGAWTRTRFCAREHLDAFALRVQSGSATDKLAATNIRFKCSSTGQVLEGEGLPEGEFGSWSDACEPPGRGIRCLTTRVQDPTGAKDQTALNDVMFVC